MSIQPFSAIYTFFDASVAGVITTGTTNMIALISPLMAASFGLYVMLVLASYWRGSNDEPVMDFIFRMMAWCAIISCGLNISLYQLYVVPFINGLGDELAGVVGPHYSAASSLDTMLAAFIDSFVKVLHDASGISGNIKALLVVVIVGLLGGAFMCISILYIVLAKLALGILIAIGPLFISMALFPATRDWFKNWTAQCLNYVFLVMLFSFIAQIEISMVSGLIPATLELSKIFELTLVCVLMILVSLNMPSLAAALAGGVGISSMIRKLPGLPKLPAKSGGSISPESPRGNAPPSESPRGGSLAPEQK